MQLKWLHYSGLLIKSEMHIYDFDPQGSARVPCRPLVIKEPTLWSKILLLCLQWWSRKTKLMWAWTHVCPSILASGARTAGLIGTGEALFDAPERWKVDGFICRAIGATRHVPRTISQTLEKSLFKAVGQTNGWIRLKLCGPMATIGEQVSLL